MKKMWKLLNNRTGAVAPLVAVLLVLIVVCVALVVDLGHVHNVKVEMQRAVDAAALAAAKQLDGSSDQEDRAENAAEATAGTNNVDNALISEEIDAGNFTLQVEFGRWNKDNLGDPILDNSDPDNSRYVPGGTPVNAVRVTALRNVDHTFFFFGPDGTDVATDAIAVNLFEEQTIPIALVSCIPTGGGSLNVAAPGLSVCDVTTYEFHSDTEDTAAWTSLSFYPAKTPNILEFLDEDGIETFNRVVYGDLESHAGLENTEVIDPDNLDERVVPVPDEPAYSDTTRGCKDNNGLNIDCGLGVDISLDPEDFDDIHIVDSGKIDSDAQDDPLQYDNLPRWYHFNLEGDPADDFDWLEDAFTRVWTMDGHLVSDQDDLADLFFEVNQPYGANDHRFKKFIDCQGACSDVANRNTYSYKPDYGEVLKYAGYPPVWVNNGTIPPALDAFLNGLLETTDEDNTFDGALSSKFPPFNEGNATNSGGTGNTVQLTVPVIFAGPCDEWKALSTGPPKNDIKLYYVGTANFLVTRAWKNPDCFFHDENTLEITNTSPTEGSCSGITANYFDPQITSGTLAFECAGGKTPSAALEGIIRPPLQGENAQAGIRKILLVE